MLCTQLTDSLSQHRFVHVQLTTTIRRVAFDLNIPALASCTCLTVLCLARGSSRSRALPICSG